MAAKKGYNHPGQAQNLRAHGWQKGQSGNPKGRKKGNLSLTGHIKRILSENDESKAKELAEKIIELAGQGCAPAIKEVFSRVDGPIAEKINVGVDLSDLNESELEFLERILSKRPTDA